MFFLFMIEQGNTIVKHPERGHLCMVQHKSNSVNVDFVVQKVSVFVDAFFLLLYLCVLVLFYDFNHSFPHEIHRSIY